MEADLGSLPPTVLPEGYGWVPWSSELIDVHAETLYQSFAGEIDALVFASLGSRDGCRLLMTEISRKPGFLPGSTWLLASPWGYCGTVQGVRERTGIGSIQNLGVLAAHRGLGLGGQLLVQAMHGFRAAGLLRCLLEVTASNDRAVRLYRRLGFRRSKTLYKAVLTSSWPVPDDLAPGGP
jgi:ribosomal protein S18 acetylase RimI-like enzyme